MKPLVLLTALLILAVPSFAQTPERRAEIGADVPAGKPYIYKHSAGKPRQMEIFFPPGHDPAKAKVPGMILFHGGAWLGGSLREYRNTCAYFASRGLVCATAEYQMLKMNKAEAAKLPEGESHKRVCVIDAKSAIRWFKQHAGELGVNPARSATDRFLVKHGLLTGEPTHQAAGHGGEIRSCPPKISEQINDHHETTPTNWTRRSPVWEPPSMPPPSPSHFGSSHPMAPGAG